MAKSFAGFSEQQKEVLARKLGFNGPMDQFQNFLNSNTGLQQKFAAYENKAKAMVEGAKEIRGFSAGGDSTPMWERLGFASQAEYLASLSKPTKTPEQIKKEEEAKKVEEKKQAEAMAKTPAGTNSVPVTQTIDGTTSKSNVTAVVPNLNSEGQQVSKDMMNNPEKYVTTPETSKIEVEKNQLINSGVGQAAGTDDVTASKGKATAADVETVDKVATVSQEDKTKANTYKATQVGDKIEDAWDEQGPVKGELSSGSLAQAVTVDPSVDATVAGQLTKLMSQFEGGNIPPWAAGAVRNVNAIMANRGMGASSMAASATTQAAMESALQIAIADASTYSQFELANLNNRQQAALQNAQAFLQMDLANLDNENAFALSKMQSITQGLLSDQAAANAASQFNATSKNQTDQFFAELASQVKQFNAAQKNNMAQFNANSVNTANQFNAAQFNEMSQFNAQLKTQTEQFNRQVNEARDQFNANNQLVIAQSNAEWRRQVTTINNAEDNENARLAATAANGMTAAAYATMMQTERDYYAFLFQASENAQQRAAEMVMAKYTAGANAKAGKAQALGSLAGSLINGIFG